MENKIEYFKFMREYSEVLLSTSDIRAGKLAKAMVNYMFNDEEPELSEALQKDWRFLKKDMSMSKKIANKKTNYDIKVEEPKEVTTKAVDKKINNNNNK